MVGCWSVILDIVFFSWRCLLNTSDMGREFYWTEWISGGFFFQARFPFREIEVSYFSKPCPHQSWCAPVVAAVRIWVRLSGSRSVRSGWVGRSLLLSHNSQGHKHKFFGLLFFKIDELFGLFIQSKVEQFDMWNKWWNCETATRTVFLLCFWHLLHKIAWEWPYLTPDTSCPSCGCRGSVWPRTLPRLGSWTRAVLPLSMVS